MTEPKFTPGPWRSNNVIHEDLSGECYTEFGVECVETRRGICGICGADSEEEMLANASLLATAPDFYEDEEKKLAYLKILKGNILSIGNKLKMSNTLTRDMEMTFKVAVQSIDIIIRETEELLAKARGEVANNAK